MQLVNIGFGNLVSVGRLIAVVSPDSAPIKRLPAEKLGPRLGLSAEDFMQEEI